nr:iron donor protein CyaY [Kwoniella shandongensis]KAA5525050.1 iron donor protein CyaY [Kwoniella shandongensis]
MLASSTARYLAKGITASPAQAILLNGKGLRTMTTTAAATRPTSGTYRSRTHVRDQASGNVSAARPMTRTLHRSFASSSRVCAAPLPPTSEQTITHEEYEEVSEEDMDKLHENLEILCEQYGPDDWEVEYSSGVMTLILPPHGTYVINKQPPNLQIWMSSPLSGPSRFEYVDGKWTHHRKSEVTLGTLLEDELRTLLEKQGVEGKDWEGTGLS